jgi:hypothetical protein
MTKCKKEEIPRMLIILKICKNVLQIVCFSFDITFGFVETLASIINFINNWLRNNVLNAIKTLLN